MEEIECQVCGATVGRGPSGLGIKQHSAMHRREFRRITGEREDDYQEVREFFDRHDQPTLHEAALPDEQKTLSSISGGR